jgi:hypothetical protein
MAKNTMGFRDAYTQTLDIDIYPKGNDGANGISIIGVTVDNRRHLLCTLSNAEVIDAGEVPAPEGTFDVEIVNSLPASGSISTMYCVPLPSEEQTEIKKYEEYFYISSAWEKVGTATIDLSSYYTKTEADAITDALDDKIDQEVEDRKTAIAAHTNSETVTTDLSAKESTYYLLGTEDSIGKGTGISQAKTTVEGSGVKYESGSEQENGKLYVDEERVTTGLYYTISE